jgi:hyperosmotically inducible periplasmic protein
MALTKTDSVLNLPKSSGDLQAEPAKGSLLRREAISKSHTNRRRETMNKMSLFLAIVMASAICFGAPGSAPAAQETVPAADNTKMNKQEKELSADQQSENAADRKITQKIRRAIVKNKSLSQYAHNVKIITRAGAVTLKGPVRTEKEKSIIEKAAAQVAGKTNVTSELEVVPENK